MLVSILLTAHIDPVFILRRRPAIVNDTSKLPLQWKAQTPGAHSNFNHISRPPAVVRDDPISIFLHMARRVSAASTHRRSGGGRSSSQKKSPVALIIVIALIAAGLVGAGIWYVLASGQYSFQRNQLDSYIENSPKTNILDDGAGVYVDMSDGMNSAYASPDAQSVLQGIINKLAANKAIEFYEMANLEIDELELPHSELYSYMLNPASYASKQQAPVEEALEEILDRNQPAVLLTDYEEYRNGQIYTAAYAKKYFIEWLAKGFNITFYKSAFNENGRQKYMFVTVFDDNANRLGGLVHNAIAMANNPAVEMYVLGARDFSYPTYTDYPSLKQGGNYHNKDRQDVVTAVQENGGAEDYVSYTKTVASASGNGAYLPLDGQAGIFAEYYPLGVDWASAVKLSQDMAADGIDPGNKYSHLLSKLFIDFGAQSGFTIDNVEVRVFDMNGVMQAMSGQMSANKPDMKAVNAVSAPELNMMLTAAMQPVAGKPEGWEEILVDFHPDFKGSFTNGIDPSSLLRANIVISSATPNIARAEQFFSWPGNPSLVNSVKEALTAGSSNPCGRVLYTYYLRSMGY